MALTEFNSVISVITEKAFNDMVTNMRRQRPAIFNFASPGFRSSFTYTDQHPRCDLSSLATFCKDLREFIHPVFISMAEKAEKKDDWDLISKMLVTPMDVVSVPGFTSDDNPFGIEWCMQVTELDVDIHPESVHQNQLPPELNPPLKEQTLSFRIRICAGINCPGKDILTKYTPAYTVEKDTILQTIIDLLSDEDDKKKREKDGKKEDRPKDDNKDKDKDPVEVTGFPFNPRNTICTCIDLFALVKIERDPMDRFVGLKLENLEIVDIPEPKGLESILECFIKTTITLGIFPKTRVGIDKLLLEITTYLLDKLGLSGLLEIKLTPISADVPFNPALEEDALKLMLTISKP